jgi:hypothetical protein
MWRNFNIYAHYTSEITYSYELLCGSVSSFEIPNRYLLERLAQHSQVVLSNSKRLAWKRILLPCQEFQLVYLMQWWHIFQVVASPQL